MTVSPPNESPAEAAYAALHPYPWRGYTPAMVTRWVLAASDREQVRHLLTGVPGITAGRWDVLEPAGRDDVRIGALVELLESHRWTELRLRTVCTQLLRLLDRAA